jgi:hypothetical protein
MQVEAVDILHIHHIFSRRTQIEANILQNDIPIQIQFKPTRDGFATNIEFQALAAMETIVSSL